jgi:hypothetical protein
MESNLAAATGMNLSAAPWVTSTGKFNPFKVSFMLGVSPTIFARTLGGTIMLKATIVSKSSWLGCFSKQWCKKLRVAAMLLARSSETMRGRHFDRFAEARIRKLGVGVGGA